MSKYTPRDGFRTCGDGWQTPRSNVYCRPDGSTFVVPGKPDGMGGTTYGSWTNRELEAFSKSQKK